MAPTARTPYHPLIYGYLKKYQDDPTSRVFAPLAEAYRKAGLIDEAIQVAKEGLKIHPHFTGGKVALSRALFDKKCYQEVIDELLPIIQDVPDNLVAQKLLADSCLMLGRLMDALNSYKMYLYFSPQDQEIAQMVRELEIQAYEKGSLVLNSDPKGADFNIVSAQSAMDDDPEFKKQRKIDQIEFLQSLLQKVERYKAHVRTS